eukprot:gnl/Spiro4/7617_TR4003_c0_g1_i1.p2 gnl/Spiro4/7617_TR4003_c0_g1~~gnl/Spiro4/7617_TR4003_c0_g1_i1.p2  ORF type:complete len:312 (-),score=75.02 gnl/Spiro4/7617_TR4003_c0_g1_i1:248-1102(-)
METFCAPGKLILLGEHSVVFGQPAVAMPFRALQASAVVSRHSDRDTNLVVEAPDFSVRSCYTELAPPGPPCRLSNSDSNAPDSHGRLDHQVEARLLHAVFGALRLYGAETDACARAIQVTLTSQIPPGAGLGSSTACTAAVCRAVVHSIGRTIADADLADLCTRVESLFGTVSGVDSAVICHDTPVCFVRGQPPRVLRPQGRFVFVVADTGVTHSTSDLVAQVARRVADNPPLHEVLAQMGVVAQRGVRALEAGNVAELAAVRAPHRAVHEREPRLATPTRCLA